MWSAVSLLWMGLLANQDCTQPIQINAVGTMYAHVDFPVDFRATYNRTRCGVTLWSVDSGPPGFSIDGAGGLFYWTPTAAELGNHTITIRLREYQNYPADFPNNPTFEDTETFTAVVDNNTMTYPLWRDYRTEAASIEILGRAEGAYSLEYREEEDPGNWIPITGLITSPVPVTGPLGTWDVSGLPDGGHYRLRLIVGPSIVENQVIIDRTLKAGWSKRTPGAITNSVTVSDIDDDGLAEVLVLDRHRNLFCWKIDGSLLWSVRETTAVGTVYSAPSVGDITGDGVPEVVVAFTQKVMAYAKDGTAVPGFPVDSPPDFNIQYRMTPTLADIDGDGALDILIATMAQQSVAPAQVFVHRYDSTLPSVETLAGWPNTLNDSITFASPSVADLDGDGGVDVVFANRDYCFAWRADGTALPGWSGGVLLPAPTTGASTNGAGATSATSQPAIADLDNDGSLEVVVGSNVLTSAGTVKTGWAGGKAGAQNSLSPAVGDLDGNPANGLEVVLGRHAWHADGTAVAGFPLPLVVSPSVLGNCGGVDHLDVVAGTRNSLTPRGVVAFHAHDPPDPIAGYPKSLYGETLDGGAPVIGDFDNDGLADIAVAITDGSYGGVVAVYDMPFENFDEKHEWPMLGHDVRRTGRYGPPRPNRPRDLTVSVDRVLVWTDRSAVEDAYVIEASVTGAPGTYVVVATLPADTTTWTHSSPGSYLYYRVRARRTDPASGATILSAPSPPAMGVPDVIPPTVSIQGPTSAATFSTSTASVDLDGIAADNLAVARVDWWNAGLGSGGQASGATNWNATIGLVSGTNVITVTATDTSGNIAIATITVTYTPSNGGGGGGSGCGSLGIDVVLLLGLLSFARRRLG